MGTKNNRINIDDILSCGVWLERLKFIPEESESMDYALKMDNK